MKLHSVFLALALASTGPALLASEERDSYAVLQEQDIRLATIANRLLTANSALCTQHMPVTGMLLHSRDQYRAAREEWFANGDTAIWAIVPQSPAAQAGLLQNDALLAVGALPLSVFSQQEDRLARDQAFNLIANKVEEDTLPLTIGRGEQEIAISIPVTPACLAAVELLADNGKKARSDGRHIQISYGLAVMMTDEQLASIFAHEMAHVVLHHRRRLEAEDVSKGLFSELGRSGRLNRRVEEEADLMSVHLLLNAGYDPQIAADFWRSEEGRDLDDGLFRSMNYASPSRRADKIEEEIANYIPDGATQSWPSHLLELRDRPFGED